MFESSKARSACAIIIITNVACSTSKCTASAATFIPVVRTRTIVFERIRLEGRQIPSRASRRELTRQSRVRGRALRRDTNHEVSTHPRATWKLPVRMRTMASRAQTCMQSVSSTDNYVFMTTFVLSCISKTPFIPFLPPLGSKHRNLLIVDCSLSPRSS